MRECPANIPAGNADKDDIPHPPLPLRSENSGHFFLLPWVQDKWSGSRFWYSALR
jgi:hypothetical protein